MVPVSAGDGILLVPKNFQESAHVRAGAVSLQSRQEASKVDSVVWLAHVEEKQEHGFLIHACQILQHIWLQDLASMDIGDNERSEERRCLL